MKTGAPATARSAFYDRNPLQIILRFTGDLAPHGWVLHASYTVPTARKAKIERVHLRVQRDAQAIVPGYSDAIVQYQPAGGAVGSIARVSIRDLVIGANQAETSGEGGTLSAGDLIQVGDEDTSNGGLVWYEEIVMLLEFDA
jgi:hypothetical protein